jgi:hypothetical protein
MKPMRDPFILHRQTVTAIECLHYSTNLPTSVGITGCDSLLILQQAIDASSASVGINRRLRVPRYSPAYYVRHRLICYAQRYAFSCIWEGFWLLYRQPSTDGSTLGFTLDS